MPGSFIPEVLLHEGYQCIKQRDHVRAIHCVLGYEIAIEQGYVSEERGKKMVKNFFIIIVLLKMKCQNYFIKVVVDKLIIFFCKLSD